MRAHIIIYVALTALLTIVNAAPIGDLAAWDDVAEPIAVENIAPSPIIDVPLPVDTPLPEIDVPLPVDTPLPEIDVPLPAIIEDIETATSATILEAGPDDGSACILPEDGPIPEEPGKIEGTDHGYATSPLADIGQWLEHKLPEIKEIKDITAPAPAPIDIPPIDEVCVTDDITAPAPIDIPPIPAPIYIPPIDEVCVTDDTIAPAPIEIPPIEDCGIDGAPVPEPIEIPPIEGCGIDGTPVPEPTDPPAGGGYCGKTDTVIPPPIDPCCDVKEPEPEPTIPPPSGGGCGKDGIPTIPPPSGGGCGNDDPKPPEPPVDDHCCGDDAKNIGTAAGSNPPAECHSGNKPAPPPSQPPSPVGQAKGFGLADLFPPGQGWLFQPAVYPYQNIIVNKFR